MSGGWGGVFVGINTSHPGGVAYVQSVIDQWVDWGVDAIEADDYMGGQADPSAHPYVLYGLVFFFLNYHSQLTTTMIMLKHRCIPPSIHV